ncbi:MAG: glycoside hydrolase, partial [Gemmatimonadaceae bacterium]|nr:glycoside hydrolase [Gemmatimonadaceae bacterium]
MESQIVDPKLTSNLEWRMIGPFRGGRTVGAQGVRGQPNVFYIGVNNGGVWKTDDFGLTWRPIFDDQPTGSIGDIAVAQSNPNVIYVGSGEGLQRPDLSTGNGMYKSTDAGKTWTHLGLRDAQQIGGLAVDPKNENRLFVAALGHPFGPNPERGVYRSLDGGLTFERVLYKNEDVGAIQVTIDPNNSQIVYADMWAGRYAPWEASFNGPGSGLYKSTDGGTTWAGINNGFPTEAEGRGRIGFAIAPSNSNRMYALVDARQGGGLYISNDAGGSWKLVNTDNRIWGRGADFAEVQVHPKNPDIVYSANVASWRSFDAGKTFESFKGAPGGDDYHRLWINPDNPDIMLLASDQGATISVNNGRTWSSWYNQPTAQFYHVITDNQVPYWVYGAQQESGSAGVISRGDNGAITFRDWHTVGVEEYGYVAPDPLNPNIIYGGRVSRYDTRTKEVQNISPEPIRSGKVRMVRTLPVIFSPVDPRTLYFGTNFIFRTRTGGDGWDVISPDLTRESYELPATMGIYAAIDPEKGKHRGVVYTIAPSFKNVNTIWAGTEDGLIHLTRDGGKTWKNVTPPQLTPWSKVSLMTASHFDDNTAYAAVNRLRLDDLRPHIYRTHDGGVTWTEIVRGIPAGDVVDAVREDPVRKGLLFAGTENAVYFSLDDGENWQSLRNNMPATAIRDLVVHETDLVVGTHGRSFWILDDISPLRQLNTATGNTDVTLFKPRMQYRFRRNKNTDTPLPPEEPAGKNPPDGAIIRYYLARDVSSPVTLEILDRAGRLVRKYSSTDSIGKSSIPPQLPSYWMRPPQKLSNSAGAHTFV